MLISSSPPAVSADTHDHGDRRPSTSDATLVHTPIASMASATSDPCHSRRIKRAVQRPRPPQKVSHDQLRPRPEPPPPITDRLTRAPRAAPRPAVSLPAHRQQRRADHLHPYRRRAKHTSGSSTCVARHDRSRQRPRRGRNRRTPPASEPLATASNPSLPTRPPDNAGTPTGRQQDPPRPQHDRPARVYWRRGPDGCPAERAACRRT